MKDDTATFESDSTATFQRERSHTFRLDEICQLTGLPRRTIRYYIQTEMVSRPIGAGRGAHYDRGHLEQLLTIRKWQDAGLSLKRIQELMTKGGDEEAMPPEAEIARGSVEVRSHIFIDRGVELSVQPSVAQLSPKQLRTLATRIAVLYDEIKRDDA